MFPFHYGDFSSNHHQIVSPFHVGIFFYQFPSKHYCRTVDELKKPFESEDSPVRKAGLSLFSIETKLIPRPYKQRWIENGADPIKHANFRNFADRSQFVDLLAGCVAATFGSLSETLD